MASKVTVKRTGRTWGVYVSGELVEGGFFSREAAEAAATALQTVKADPDFPVTDWQYEVANGDTCLGYADWVAGQREMRRLTETK